MIRRAEQRNVLILAACQALFQTGSVLIITVGGLAGLMLAPDKSLATLPIASMVTGTALATIPASLLMGRIGRRTGFMLGTLIGALGGAIAAFGLISGSFVLFCVGNLLVGAHQAFAQFYRFAAAEAASPLFKSRAISFVLAGGVVAAIAGPSLGTLAKDLVGSVAFVGSYAAVVVLSLLATVLLAFIDIPTTTAGDEGGKARPLAKIVRQPVFLVALIGAAVGYGVMILAMTATPLAMVAHHHPVSDAAFVIQWHVLGMFVPSFFTGILIQRLGVLTIMFAGILLLFAHVGIALSGFELLHFLSALVLLGMGWNFLYIGGTTLLTETYQPNEKSKVQAINDFLIFAVVVMASFLSGGLLQHFDWTGVNLSALPFLTAVGIAIILLAMRRLTEKELEPPTHGL